MRGPLGNLMQQAQRVQDNLKKAQEELASIEVTGQSGGGMVQVTLTGRMECRKVRIEPSVLGDPEMAEDLIVAAINDAHGRSHRRAAAAGRDEAAVLSRDSGLGTRQKRGRATIVSRAEPCSCRSAIGSTIRSSRIPNPESRIPSAECRVPHQPMTSAPLLDQLIDALRCLPGVGQKSAQRMALHLLERNREGGRRLAAVLADAIERIGNCAECRTLTEQAVCALCGNPQRDAGLLCVVESPSDLAALEVATGFRGRYFVLHGRLSPLDGLGPRELGLEQLAYPAVK